MTITIYELLGMFKKGKFPKQIRIYEGVYIYDEGEEDYIQDGDLTREHLFEEYKINDILDDEVEILEEENKIEKIDKISINNISHPSGLTAIANMQWENNDTFRRKINEIIDEINKLKEDK